MPGNGGTQPRNEFIPLIATDSLDRVRTTSITNHSVAIQAGGSLEPPTAVTLPS